MLKNYEFCHERYGTFFFLRFHSKYLFTTAMRHCAEKPKTRERVILYNIILERILFADFMRICRKNSCPHGKRKKNSAQNGKYLNSTQYTYYVVYIELNRVAEKHRILFRFIYLFRQCTCPVVHIIFPFFRSV